MRRLFSRSNPERDAARDELSATLAAVAAGDLSSTERLPALWEASRLKPREVQERTRETLQELADAYLEDEVISTEEEERFLLAAEKLGWDHSALVSQMPDVINRLVVAVVNGGRLPVADPGTYSLLPKKGEIVHVVLPAQLLKEQAVREWRGGSNGFSFRVAKGVTYRTGRSRGQLVTVGTKFVVGDTGELVLTSQRALFAGTRKTLEFAYPKLVSIEVFNDGLCLGVSNRQNASLFKLASGDVAAAIINAAAQRLQ